MKALQTFALAAASAALLGSAAVAEERRIAATEAPAFNVLEQDARIPFSNLRINGYEVADDDSILIRTGASQWYRATVWEPCRSYLRFENAIGFETRGTSTFDRWSYVVVDGHRCPVDSIDRIERPRRSAEG